MRLGGLWNQVTNAGWLPAMLLGLKLASFKNIV